MTGSEALVLIGDAMWGISLLFYDGSKHTMAACKTRGVYTTQISGANQTPSNSQFQIAVRVSSKPNTSQPSARQTYAVNATKRVFGLQALELSKGMARTTASEAASEKLRTEVIEITVDARHRFMDFKTIHRGATVFDGVAGIFNAMRDTREVKPKSIGDNT